ncbi:MAG: hypothetical protein ABI895_09345 [Deltaproteobacteria bacterium]
MTEVLVERHRDEPLTDADMARMIEQGSGCLALHRVRWNRSLLSSDGRELLCHFSSVDAESVRLALRALGSLHAVAWACTVHDAPGLTGDELARANVLVSSRFEAPLAFEELTSQGDGAACLLNHRVRFVRTLLSTDRRRRISLCQAPDAESVRVALREAQAPVERVWAFRQFRP